MDKAYHHGDLRAALVAAGTQIVEDQQRFDISLREIARSVGVSPTAAYRHFQSKDALLCRIAADGFADLTKRLEATRRFKDSRKSLTRLGMAYIQFALDKPAIFRLMFSGPLSVETARQHNAEIGSDAFAVLQTQVAKLTEQDLESAGLRTSVTRLWSVVHGYAMLLLDGRLNDAKPSARMIESVISPVVNTLAPH